nr:YrhB domain-containing protein [Microbacterium testaceum]
MQGYQSAAFAVQGDVFQALAGNGPCVIPENGDAVSTPSSAEPVDAQRARLAAGDEVMRRALMRENGSSTTWLYPIAWRLAAIAALRPFDHLEGAFRLRLLITESDGLMRTKTEAEQAALRFLSTSAADDGVERVIPREPVEAGADWVFSYQGHGYVQRGDLDEMLIGNMPIVVPKRDQLPYALNALDDVDYLIARLKRSDC